MIDKEFTSNYGSSISTYWTNSTNATCTSFYVTIGGHNLHIAATLTTNVDIADTTVQLGTISLNDLGISSSIFNRRVTGYSDTGDALLGCVFVSDTGVINSYDVFPHGTLASGSTVYINIDIITNASNMLDTKCSKFYWKRTA